MLILYKFIKKRFGMSVTYTCHLQLTEEQKQMDEIYGVYTYQKRTIILNEIDQTFSFVYQYYYEKEVNYQMMKQQKNQTKVEGKITKEGEVFHVIFENGVQNYQDRLNKKDLFPEGKFSGKISFFRNADNNLRISSFQYQPKSLKGSLLYLGQIFKMQKPKQQIQPKVQQKQAVVQQQKVQQKPKAEQKSKVEQKQKVEQKPQAEQKPKIQQKPKTEQKITVVQPQKQLDQSGIPITYTANLIKTEDQRQDDSTYGIYQYERRTLILNQKDLTCSFLYQYYYEREVSYKMTKQVKNVTKFEGKMTYNGSLFTIQFDNGNQNSQDQLNKTNLFPQGKFSGKISFNKTPENNIKIVSIQLKPDNLDRKSWIIRSGQLYQRQKPKVQIKPKVQQKPVIVQQPKVESQKNIQQKPKVEQKPKIEAKPATLQQNSQKSIKANDNQAPKQIKQNNQTKQKIQSPKKVEPTQQQTKSQLTNLQKIQLIFQNLKKSQIKQIKSSQIQLISKQINIKIPLTKNIVLKYFKNQNNISFQDFKLWIKIQQQNQIKEVSQKYKNSKNYQNFQQNIQKIKNIINLCNDQKKTLKIGLGVGDKQGKTSIKCGFYLKQSPQKNNILTIDIKTKKKSQLKLKLQSDLKSLYKSSPAYLIKLCKINFIQTQKSLKIQLNLDNLQQLLFKDLLQSIQTKMTQYNNSPNLKFQAQLVIKNSIRLNDDSLQNKKWIKWINQGFNSTYHIQGNNQIIKMMVSPFTDIFPSLKIIRSGQINLKLKGIDNIDKFYDKLGINELCQQLPNLNTFSQSIFNQQVNYDKMPLIEYFIKKYLIFAANVPNQKIQVQINARIHHLNLHLNLVGDACKEISMIINKLTVQNFD